MNGLMRLHNTRQHPSPATKSAVDRETDLLYDYVGKRNALFFASLLLLDCVSGVHCLEA